MTTATDGFRLYRFNTAKACIEEGSGEFGHEWTCFVRKLPGVHVYKPYKLTIFHYGKVVETVRIYRPGMWNRIGKNVVRRRLKNRDDT